MADKHTQIVLEICAYCEGAGFEVSTNDANTSSQSDCSKCEGSGKVFVERTFNKLDQNERPEAQPPFHVSKYK